MWLLLTLVFLPLETHAFLNFFITQQEMMKLLGINAELFYIQDGVINSYALNFVVKIPAYISDMHFSWQSLTTPLPYVLRVKYDGEGALLPPQLNISTTGTIPTTVQKFRIRLVCTGHSSTQTEVHVHLNVSTHRNLQIHFRRNKICLQGASSHRNDSDADSLHESTGSLYIAAASAFALIAMTLVLARTSRKCLRDEKKQLQEPLYTTAIYDANQVFIRLGTEATSSVASGSYATIASLHKTAAYATSDTVQEKLHTLWVDSGSITLEEVTAEGAFGRIYRGTFKTQTAVIVKTVTEAATQEQIGQFLKEGLFLYRMVHKNVLSVLAVNNDNPRQPFLVYPNAKLGNLKRFLTKCRQREEKPTPSTQELVDMGVQILLGVMYLNSQRCVYEDLATRNCVLDANLQIRIADSSLSRDLFPNDYYCLGDNNSRPIKWLAIETILHKQYDTASLVWSFGVVLWELTTFAQEPYADVTPEDICTHLGKGFRLSQAVGCPDELYAVMTSCWLQTPSQRPTFVQILAYLQDFYTALGRYV